VTPQPSGPSGRGTPAPGVEMVEGFGVRLDLAHDPLTRTWLERRPGGRVRVGLDPLEVEASGTVAAVALLPQGTTVARGEQIGSLEAEKFVGPLHSPLAGTVEAVNQEVLAHPAEVDRDPYGAWLVEICPEPGAWERSELVEGEQAVRSWFARAVDEYRRKGVLAE
jgi:glycine cleavage system H protein